MDKILDRFNITNTQYLKYQKYYEILNDKNKVMNLTAITDYEGVFIKHFYDSLLLTEITKDFDNLIDVGSGAGFPGMVIKILRPEVNVTLLDGHAKRFIFLEDLQNKLCLKKKKGFCIKSLFICKFVIIKM